MKTMRKLKFLTQLTILSVSAVLTFVACDRDDDDSCLINTVKMEIDPATATINKGATLRLGLVFTPADYPKKQVIWKSQDGSIATVDADGRVTGIKEGITTITATLVETNQTATAEITVIAEDVIPEFTFQITPKELVVFLGDDPVRPEVTFDPEGLSAEYKHLLWKSADESIATVDEDGNIYGKKVGETTLTVTSPINKTEQIIQLIVKEKAPEFTFSVAQKEIEVYVEGDPVQPVVVFDPADLAEEFKTLLWTSADETIATVNEDGNIYGKKKGETTITVSSPINKEKVTIKVTVLPKKEAADYIVFDDNLFKTNVLIKYDKDKDGELSVEEAKAIEQLDLSYKNIKSVKGMEYFINLKELTLSNLLLTELDLSTNTQLVHLNVSGNKEIKSLDLSKNTALKTIDVSANSLTTLVLPESDLLEELTCKKNPLGTLDLQKYTQLKKLYAPNCELTSLLLPATESLTHIALFSNLLKELDISANKKLESLTTFSNKELASIYVWDGFDVENPTSSIQNVDKDFNTQFVVK